MKKVNIRQMHIPDKKSILIKQRKYSVYLGNNITTLFSNEKKARKFITDVNRIYNEKITELNFIYIDLFSEWRRCWFTINDNLDNEFSSINKMFKLVISTHSNQNHWAFTHTINICNEFINITNVLKINYTNKKDFASANIIKSIENRIKSIMNDLENLGIDNK